MSFLLELGGENTATSVCSPSNLHGCFFLANLAGSKTPYKSSFSKMLYWRLRIEKNPLHVVEKKGFFSIKKPRKLPFVVTTRHQLCVDEFEDPPVHVLKRFSFDPRGFLSPYDSSSFSLLDTIIWILPACRITRITWSAPLSLASYRHLTLDISVCRLASGSWKQ